MGNKPALPHGDAHGWSMLKTEIQCGLCSHLQFGAFVYSWRFVYLSAVTNLVNTVCDIFLSCQISISPRVSHLQMTGGVCANMWECHQGKIQGHRGHSRLI